MSQQPTTDVPASGTDDDAPPPGTAIVRPLRHVQAVRERHLEQLAERSLGPESRSARAWSWALGETAIAPVTDRPTDVPPGRSDIEAEIVVADERRLRGDRENRADGAATVLRWLIGEDDHLPVEGQNRGELVGSFGDIVRSRDQIDEILFQLHKRRRRAVADSMATSGGSVDISDPDYLAGAIATLVWVSGSTLASPLSGERIPEPTTRDLKTERVHADDVIDQRPALTPGSPSPSSHYALAVKHSVDWLLGDATTLA